MSLYLSVACVLIQISAAGVSVVPNQPVLSYSAGLGPVAYDPTSIQGGSWQSEGPATAMPVIDMGLPAWRIEDLSATIGTVYRQPLSISEINELESYGWSLSATLRMIDGGTNEERRFPASIFFGFAIDGARWDIYADLDANGDLLLYQASELSEVLQAIQVTTDMSGSEDYHKIEILREAGATDAKILIDGLIVGAISPTNLLSDGPEGIRFGAGSSQGEGVANFRSVELVALPAPGAFGLAATVCIVMARRRR